MTGPVLGLIVDEEMQTRIATRKKEREKNATGSKPACPKLEEQTGEAIARKSVGQEREQDTSLRGR